MDYREQLEMVHRFGLRGAQQIEIDLSIAIVDKIYAFAGNYFYVKDAPDQISYIDVRVNTSDQPAVSWTKQTGFLHPFTKLYITTPAGQAGTMKVLIAAEAPQLFEIIDNRSAISESMDNVVAELRGDVAAEDWGTEKTVGSAAAVEILDANANRKACLLQAKSTNTGIIYIGFDNTVTSTKWIAELQPGMSFGMDDYRGALFARASAAGQLLGYGEW